MHLYGNSSLLPQGYLNADVDVDGGLSSADALYILEYNSGTRESLPEISQGQVQTHITYFKNTTNTGTYYLWVRATDQLGNTRTACSEEFNLDNTPPALSVSGVDNNWTQTKNINITVSDVHSGLDTSNEYQYMLSDQNETEPTANTGWTNYTSGNSFVVGNSGCYVDGTLQNTALNGEYYLWIKGVSDTLGNEEPARVTGVLKFDNTVPTVTFSPDGNTTYARSQSTTVTVTDNITASDNTVSMKYYWSESTLTPSDALFTGSYSGTSGTLTQALSKNTDTGKYYLWVMVTDTAGNTTKVHSTDPFYIDNEPPQVIYIPNGSEDTVGS